MMMKDLPLETVRKMMRMVPQLAALGAEVVALDEARATLRLPYNARLVAYRETGVMAGGAVFTLMDSAMGAAVFCALEQLLPVATLDLRIDYLKPAKRGVDLLARAECYRLTHHVAFVRGTAYHAPEDAVAQAVGTFIIDRSKSPRRARNDA
ncbi:MAG: PaaI family thioesterase [Alphaproteobacteria bacterium]|nr:MAG: PaaI family thioesterase [Alphaproteobacteria bacterium]